MHHRRFRNWCWWDDVRQLFQLLHRDASDGFRHRDDLGQSVRTPLRVLSLACEGPVEFADPGWIENGAIDFDVVIVELAGKRMQDLLDQAVIVGGQVNCVQQVKAVAAISNNWFGPLQLGKILLDGVDCGQRLFLFIISGRHSCEARRVGVDQEPPAAGHVLVRCQV